MRPILTITFGETAEDVTVEAVGPQGPRCLEATRPYEAVLGVARDRQFKTADFNRVAADHVALARIPGKVSIR